MPKILSARNLTYSNKQVQKKSASQLLIKDTSLEIMTNGITAIMGPNGAGKSLLLRMIANLLKPETGEIEWFGEKRIEPKDIAIVFQKPILLRRSVEANLEHALRAFNTNKGYIKNRTKELLELGQLTDIANRPARVLSGGEQQRLAMVRALAGNPKIVLLDEATASLDPQATLSIENLIKDVSKNGIKIIMITHDKGQAKRLANDIAFMACGTICEHTSARNFLKKPTSKEAQAYISGKLLVE